MNTTEHIINLGTTEDDTFRILAQPSVHKMEILHKAYKKEWCRNGKLYPSIQNIIFAKHHGWTWLAFRRARKAEGYTF